eukprot:14559818-Ditylum_brightwellii.AAC.1
MLALVTGVAPVDNRPSCWWPVTWGRGWIINDCVSGLSMLVLAEHKNSMLLAQKNKHSREKVSTSAQGEDTRLQ